MAHGNLDLLDHGDRGPDCVLSVAADIHRFTRRVDRVSDRVYRWPCTTDDVLQTRLAQTRNSRHQNLTPPYGLGSGVGIGWLHADSSFGACAAAMFSVAMMSCSSFWSKSAVAVKALLRVFASTISSLERSVSAATASVPELPFGESAPPSAAAGAFASARPSARISATRMRFEILA